MKYAIVRALLCGLVVSVMFGLASDVQAAGKGEPGPVVPIRVELNDRQADLNLFKKMDLDVDGVFDTWARIYVVPPERKKLVRLGYRISEMPDLLPGFHDTGPAAQTEPGTQRAIPTVYHTYATLTAELQAIATARPDLVRLTSIGQSAEPLATPRELWMMKISRNPDLDEDEPEVAFIAAMHGDEVVGKELCIEFIHYLLDNYGTDSRVTDLVDSTVIWIMPSMNPDGTEAGGRYNDNGYDLNRDFPDWFQDPVNTTDGRQPETAALMDWAAQHSINLSANFHGGALVANYPFDNNATESSVFSPAPDPDHPMFVSISLTYSSNNPPMYSSFSFADGITNGAEWYAVTGGMQDWNYVWYGNYQITLEVSDVKWPSGSQLPTFWNENRESMLSYLERAHDGVRGLVTDAVTGEPVSAEIRVDGDPFPAYTDASVGDYHRLVLPGSYSMEVSAPGYQAQTIPITVAAGPAVRHDVILQPLASDLQPIAGRVEDGVAGNGVLDPGETTDVALTLKNLGAAVSGVNGKLVSTSWFADVSRAEATYPNLANQQAGDSDAPYHEIFVHPDVPTGHKVGLAVEWDAAEGTGVSEPIFLDVGAPVCADADATGLPLAIVDNQTTTSQMSIVSGPDVGTIEVTVDISHTYIGDLNVKLISPSATEVLLHNRSGGTSEDIVGTYGVNLTAAGSLDAFSGETSVGTWTLEVSDEAAGDIGNLNAWSLDICGAQVEVATPQLLLRSVEMEPDGSLLRWWPYPGLDSYKVYRSTQADSAAAFIDVTGEDGDPTDTSFKDTSTDPLVFYLVTGVGSQGEGSKGHFGE